MADPRSLLDPPYEVETIKHPFDLEIQSVIDPEASSLDVAIDVDHFLDFDLSWAALQAGSEGRLLIALDRETGFTLGLSNYDFYLFGKQYDNAFDADISVGAAISVNMPAGVVELVEDTFHLDLKQGFPIAWNLDSGYFGVSFGQDWVDLLLPGLSSDTFNQGLALPDFSIGNGGTFAIEFEKTIEVLGADFASSSISLSRSMNGSTLGPIELSVDKSLGGDLNGLSFDLEADSNGQVDVSISGAWSVPAEGFWFEPFDVLDGAGFGDDELDMASLDLSISNDSFTGSATALGTTVYIQLGTSGSKATVDAGITDIPLPLPNLP